MVVATSGTPDPTKALLDRVGVLDMLNGIVTGDDVEESKPDPDIVGAALQKLGLPAEDVHMLGDTPNHVEAARRAGVGPLAVRTGGWSDEGLKGAVRIFDSPADRLTHYAEIFGRH